ncbi:MAG: hypothetical protein ACKVWV_07500 [Planctomycetota bacterium]
MTRRMEIDGEVERVLAKRADDELLRVHAVEEALLLRQACFARLAEVEALRVLGWRAPDPVAWRRRARAEIAWARADGYEVSACLLACARSQGRSPCGPRVLALQALALDPGSEARFLLAAVALAAGSADEACARVDALQRERLGPAFTIAVRQLAQLAAGIRHSAS